MQSNHLGFNMNAWIFFFIKYTWTEIGIYSYCYRNRVLWIISDYLTTRLWRSNSNDDEEAHISQFKASSIPIPEHTILMLLCLEKKDFLLITFLQLLWGYYDGLCTSLLPSVSLFAASKLKNFYNQHFRWRRLEAQLDFFHSIMPYINFAYVHR